MDSKPLVSIITPFYNTPLEFLQEAIQSVFAQIYSNWELLLIDDGSTGPVTELARSYAAQSPGRVYFYEYPDRINRGHSAARNLGFEHSKGKYIAFLDADDIWMPHKLEQQVTILEHHPDVGMLYANTKYWFSWTNDSKDTRRDFVPKLGIESDSIVQPPTLLPLFLNGKASVPSMNTLLVRSEVVKACGGFDERFRSLYGDQHFYAKVCLVERVYVSGASVDWYRQHAKSTTGKAYRMNAETTARKFFLEWLKHYLVQQTVTDPHVWRELQREIWRISLPGWLPESIRLQKMLRWVKKWLLKIEERYISEALRNRMWSSHTLTTFNRLPRARRPFEN